MLGYDEVAGARLGRGARSTPGSTDTRSALQSLADDLAAHAADAQQANATKDRRLSR